MPRQGMQGKVEAIHILVVGGAGFGLEPEIDQIFRAHVFHDHLRHGKIAETRHIPHNPSVGAYFLPAR